MTDEQQAHAEAVVRERITRNGGEVGSIRVEEKRPGTVQATVVLAGEEVERQGSFALDDLLGEPLPPSPVGGNMETSGGSR